MVNGIKKPRSRNWNNTEPRWDKKYNNSFQHQSKKYKKKQQPVRLLWTIMKESIHYQESQPCLESDVRKLRKTSYKNAILIEKEYIEH